MAPTDSAIYLPFAVALFVLSAVLTWGMLRVGILDTPNQRSSHQRPVPRGGGAGIVIACVVAVSAFLMWVEPGSSAQGRIVALLVASLSVAGMGFLDDLGVVSNFRTKLLVQLLATVILVGVGGVFPPIPIPWGGAVDAGKWLAVLSVLWIFGLTNAFNFMDGLDSLAAGTAVVAALALAIIARTSGADLAFFVAVAILAATLGFLPFNLPPAKIFMGDVGSQFLGFLFAAIAVMGAAGEATALPPMVVPLLFFHFIFDTAATFVRRLWAGRKVTEAHREHLYQLMNRLGLSHLRVSLLQAAMAGLQGVGAYWMVASSPENQLLVFVPFVAFQLIYAGVVWRLARRRGLLAA